MSTTMRETAGRVRAALPGDLIVYVAENHANPTISLHGIVRAGALFDPPQKAGLARFTASMLNQGTASRDALALATAIEDLGASLSFEGGAETVTVRATMLADDFEAVLGVLAEEILRPSFPEAQIEKVRAELLNDVRVAESTTTSVAVRRANEILFPEAHPFHRHRGGTDVSIRSITRDDLIAFHRRRYRPDALVLAIVGDVDPAEVTRSVERAFQSWKAPEGPLGFELPAAPVLKGGLRRAIHMPGRSQADVVVAFPGLARTDPDYDSAMMMNYVLGGGSLSSRLMENLRDAQGLVYGVYSSLHAGIGAGPLQIRAGTNPANVERCIDSIGVEVRRLHEEGPLEDEIDAAKGFLTGVFPVRLEDNAGVAAQLVAGELYGLGSDYIERYESIINGITRDAAAAAARRYLTPDRYVLVVAGDVPAEEAHAI